MENQATLTKEEIVERRKKFFAELDAECPPITDLVATNSGQLEPLPESQEEWDNFHEHLQFVDGINRSY